MRVGATCFGSYFSYACGHSHCANKVKINEILAPFCSYQEKFILDNHLNSIFFIHYTTKIHLLGVGCAGGMGRFYASH